MQIYYIMIELMFQGNDINKTNASKECDICHYRYFSDKGFKFQLDVSNGCHDVLVMSVNLDDFAILNINGFDYRCIINEINSIYLYLKWNCIFTPTYQLDRVYIIKIEKLKTNHFHIQNG